MKPTGQIEEAEGTPRQVAEQTLKFIDDCFRELMPDASIAERVVFAIEHDISDRAGFKHIWLNLSPERRLYINAVWQEIVRLEVERLRRMEANEQWSRELFE
ncbi:MAG: hypothetical protein AB1861_08430 [Cyanobacteriota bacterium]